MITRQPPPRSESLIRSRAENPGGGAHRSQAVSGDHGHRRLSGSDRFGQVPEKIHQESPLVTAGQFRIDHGDRKTGRQLDRVFRKPGVLMKGQENDHATA